MADFSETFGLVRSILMYYSVPFRTGRLLSFYRQFIRPEDLCFDIGAHIGSRLRIWRRLGARIVAVEPQPPFMRFLERWYGGRPGITLVETALGAAPGEATLMVSRRTPTVTSLSPQWIAAVRRARSFAGVDWDVAIQVPVSTLEALIEQYGEPDFCKIDVEGSELEVLRGLSRPLRCLSFEYIPAAAEIAVDCINRLESLGDYEYNYAVGEHMHLHLESWVRGEAVSAWLKTLAPDQPSGDIYARRP
jgi:FkbM family methyltransferase